MNTSFGNDANQKQILAQHTWEVDYVPKLIRTKSVIMKDTNHLDCDWLVTAIGDSEAMSGGHSSHPQGGGDEVSGFSPSSPPVPSPLLSGRNKRSEEMRGGASLPQAAKD
uniref:Uncharacterized protein n=1 Tax=Knipowitschia caucasica TaxID=637954 RepID=A0AAV2M390_KNICA